MLNIALVLDQFRVPSRSVPGNVCYLITRVIRTQRLHNLLNYRQKKTSCSMFMSLLETQLLFFPVTGIVFGKFISSGSAFTLTGHFIRNI